MELCPSRIIWKATDKKNLVAVSTVWILIKLILWQGSFSCRMDFTNDMKTSSPGGSSKNWREVLSLLSNTKICNKTFLNEFTSINAHFIRKPFTCPPLLGYEYFKQYNFFITSTQYSYESKILCWSSPSLTLEFSFIFCWAASSCSVSHSTLSLNITNIQTKQK